MAHPSPRVREGGSGARYLDDHAETESSYDTREHRVTVTVTLGTLWGSPPPSYCPTV